MFDWYHVASITLGLTIALIGVAVRYLQLLIKSELAILERSLTKMITHEYATKEFVEMSISALRRNH